MVLMGTGHQYQPGLRSAGKSGISSRGVRYGHGARRSSDQQAGPKKRNEQQQATVCCQGCGLMPGNSARTRQVCHLPWPAARCGPVPSLCPRPGAAAEAPLLPREVAAEGHQTRLAIQAASGLGTARETLGITPGLGGSAQPPGKTSSPTAQGRGRPCAPSHRSEPATDAHMDVARNLVPTSLHLSTTLHLHSRHNLFGRHKKQDIYPIWQQKPRVLVVKFAILSTYSTYSHDGPQHENGPVAVSPEKDHEDSQRAGAHPPMKTG